MLLTALGILESEYPNIGEYAIFRSECRNTKFAFYVCPGYTQTHYTVTDAFNESDCLSYLGCTALTHTTMMRLKT